MKRLSCCITRVGSASMQACFRGVSGSTTTKGDSKVDCTRSRPMDKASRKAASVVYPAVRASTCITLAKGVSHSLVTTCLSRRPSHDAHQGGGAKPTFASLYTHMLSALYGCRLMVFSVINTAGLNSLYCLGVGLKLKRGAVPRVCTLISPCMVPVVSMGSIIDEKCWLGGFRWQNTGYKGKPSENPG